MRTVSFATGDECTTMTVGELRERLAEMPADAAVLITWEGQAMELRSDYVYQVSRSDVVWIDAEEGYNVMRDTSKRKPPEE